MSKTVLIVEDDHQMNEIICDYFDVAGYNTITADNGIEGIKLFERYSIDLVILDVMMPGLDGWSVCRKIRKQSDALIIMLTARSDEDDKLMGFELGADEYVTKPFSPKVLVARAEALLKRAVVTKETSTSEDVMAYNEMSIDLSGMSVTVDGEAVSLTSREFGLLKLFAKAPNKVLTRGFIIEQLWGYEYIGDGRVVDTNVKTLRKKLGVSGLYIKTVIGVGYKFEVSYD